MSSSFTHRTLFNTKEDADVTFVIEDKDLLAHQFILCSRSPVFKAMIKGDLAPADQRHIIADPKIKYEDFELLVKYLYMDELEQDEINERNFEKLMHLSNMYDVELLFYDCVLEILDWLDEERILKFAELGVLYNDKCGLLTKVLKNLYDFLPYLDEEDDALEVKPDAKKKATSISPPVFSYEVLDETTNKHSRVLISPELVLEIAKRCPRNEHASEELIFNHVFNWIEAKCKEEKLKLNIENVNKFFAQLWSHFEYEELSPDTLHDCVYMYEMIPEKHLLKIYHNSFKIVQADDFDDDGVEDEDYEDLSTSSSDSDDSDF